jgi:hypothetical protein
MDYTLKTSIMRRVWAIFLLRRATSLAALRLYLFAFLLWQLTLRVSLGHVWANMPRGYARGIADVAAFFENSFFNTETSVQALILAALTVALWASVRMIRSIARTSARATFARA